jgi:hypothetical protein
MFLPMMAGNCKGSTRPCSPSTGGTLCVWPERKESGSGERETGRCFCPCWQGTAEAVQGHPQHIQEVHTFYVGQRERGLKVERGRQVDVSAYVGREL